MNAATKPAKTPRPLTANQLSDLHCLWELCRANGGSSRLGADPRALIRRGLVVRVKEALRGAAGQGARYSLTAVGEAVAMQVDANRAEARRVRAANRGHNAMIG